MLGRGEAAPWDVYSSPPLTPLFIGEGARGADPSRWDLEGGGGQGGGLPPKQRGFAPLRVPPNPRCMGPRGGRPALQGLVPCPTRPMWPTKRGGPSRWTPGTPPVAPVQYRYAPETFRCSHDNFPYINLYLRTLPELLVRSGISSGTPNNIR